MGAAAVPTAPIEGQKPGTSGLRKKVAVFSAPGYLENFVQSTFDSLPAPPPGAALVVSGDGRHWSPEAARTIVSMAAANGVSRVWVGARTLMATPAVSATIRDRVGPRGERAFGAFILTASHNPGGPDGDFGVKYNCENGGPAPESLTRAIHRRTTEIAEYKTMQPLLQVDLSRPGDHDLGGGFSVEVFDGAETHLALLKRVFDFGAIRALLARPDFSMVFDGMHGVAGASARRVFCDELGADPAAALMNCEPRPDFGGGHPDPNLTYAKELVAKMFGEGAPCFGAAADGDADRNMILGSRFFVTPSDSVAVIAAHAAECIPYFSGGLRGVARSMPTSMALDKVAAKLGIEMYEVPTGWKFFGSLMDAGRCQLCGEESFGTGSDHIREKDGLWAVLAWLSILAAKARGGPLVSVESIVRAHWREFGRNYYSRFDYEEVDEGAAQAVMARLAALQEEGQWGELLRGSGHSMAKADVFCYTDPVNGEVSANQGLRFLLQDGSRFVFRLSGTGSSGATIRLYLERYVAPGGPEEGLALDTQEALKDIVALALKVSDLQALTGREAPTVIT